MLLLSFGAGPPDAAADAADLFAGTPVDQTISGTPFALVSERLNRLHTLRGSFIQEKKIAVLERPLRASGRFIFSSARGLFWQVKEPVQSTVVISQNGMLQQTDSGRFESIAPDKQAVVVGFSRTFLALFSGDKSELNRNFLVYFSGSDREWTIGLVPKDLILSRVVKQIVLYGTTLVNRLSIIEAGGDSNEIRFEELRPSPPELTAEEESAYP